MTENDHFVTIEVMINSGKYQQWILKFFGERFLNNKIFLPF